MTMKCSFCDKTLYCLECGTRQDSPNTEELRIRQVEALEAIAQHVTGKYPDHVRQGFYLLRAMFDEMSKAPKHRSSLFADNWRVSAETLLRETDKLNLGIDMTGMKKGSV